MTDMRRSRTGRARVSRGLCRVLRGTTTSGLAMICKGTYHPVATNANTASEIEGIEAIYDRIWGRRAARQAVAARPRWPSPPVEAGDESLGVLIRAWR